MTGKGGKIFEKLGTSFTGTQYTDAFSVTRGNTFSVQAIWSGTPTTTVTLQASNVPTDDRDDSDDTWWEDDPDFAAANAPAGSASSEMYNVGNAGALYYRFKFVTTSTGAMECWLGIKDTA